MQTEEYLKNVCKYIKYKAARNEISQELKDHIEETKEKYIIQGMVMEDAEQEAISQMGSAEDIGKKLNKIHKPKFDWKLATLIVILMGFGLFIAVLKQQDSNELFTYVQNTIIYIAIGTIIGIGIYFFDYKKIKKYSNTMYIVSSVILLISLSRIFGSIGGYINFFKFSFMSCHFAVPLYIIAFIGFLSDYKEKRKEQLNKFEKKPIINKNLVKIIILSILSLFLICCIPSFANVTILGLSYLAIITFYIIENDRKKAKKIGVFYGIIVLMCLLCTSLIIRNPNEYISNKIISYFGSENNSEGFENTAMMQKEILENAKFVGEANTEIISGNQFTIFGDSNYTFLYLLGKTGALVSSLLVVIIILTCVKLIYSAKIIKDEYGKLIIVGLSFLFILQSVVSILMNVNLGIRANINLPFVSYGGGYLIINIVNMALILSVYRRKDIFIYEMKQNVCKKKV